MTPQAKAAIELQSKMLELLGPDDAVELDEMDGELNVIITLAGSACHPSWTTHRLKPSNIFGLVHQYLLDSDGSKRWFMSSFNDVMNEIRRIPA